jgi:hypothetical protein
VVNRSEPPSKRADRFAAVGTLVYFIVAVAIIAFAISHARGADLAPLPRAKDPCPCADDRCRAKAALALQAAKVTVPTAMPSRERVAAKRALEHADRLIKAGRPTPTP